MKRTVTIFAFVALLFVVSSHRTYAQPPVPSGPARVYHLRHANAKEVQRALSRTYGELSIVIGEEANAIVVRGGAGADLSDVESTITQLDKPAASDARAERDSRESLDASLDRERPTEDAKAPDVPPAMTEALSAITEAARRGHAASTEDIAPELKQQLRVQVEAAFDARQDLHYAELRRLREQLAGIEGVVAVRQRTKATIVDRRVAELIAAVLDRELDGALGALGETRQGDGAPRALGETRQARPPSEIRTRDHGNREGDEAARGEEPNEDSSQDRAGANDDGTVTGRVLGPDGRPIADAKVYLAYDAEDRSAPPVRAKSSASGRFRFSVSRVEYDKSYAKESRSDWPRRSTAQVVAVADGFGPAWVDVPSLDVSNDLTLRLADDDIPIAGRVVDLEGRGIGGVTVRITSVLAWPNDKLDRWIEALGAEGELYKATVAVPPRRLDQRFSGLPDSVTTDRDGHFRLTGAGRDRVLSVWFVGPTIATTQHYEVMTRPGATIQVPLAKANPSHGTAVYYGATFEHAAAPTQPIVGVVRDKDSGAPLEAAIVQSEQFAGSPVHVHDIVKATTDADGRYRLVGMPKGSGNVLMAKPPSEKAYMAITRNVADVPGLDPIEVNFELSRCVKIQGKVTDKQSGMPIAALVEYFVPADNPNQIKLSDFQSLSANTQEDGSFNILGLPGRGLIAVRAERDAYIVGYGARDIEGADEFGFFPTEPYVCIPDTYHSVVEVNPPEDVHSFTCDVLLDAGRTISGVVLGPDNAPLPGARIDGARGMGFSFSEPYALAEFTLTGINPNRPRPVFFHQQEKDLGAALLIDGTEPSPLKVALEPCGRVSGQIVDASGVPQSGIQLSGSVSAGQLSLQSRRGGFFSGRTNEEGRFTWNGLIPGVNYDLVAVEGNLGVGQVFARLSLKSGEARNLGDIQVRAETSP